MTSNKRSPSYSELEKTVFLDLISKYKHVLECKASNAITLKEKSFAWNTLSQEYNSNFLITKKRDVNQLKKYWSNLKQQTKKTLTAERQSRYLTGGGPELPLKDIDSNVLNITPSLMKTAPVLFSSNFSVTELEDRERNTSNAIRQNDVVSIIDMANFNNSPNSSFSKDTSIMPIDELEETLSENEDFNLQDIDANTSFKENIKTQITMNKGQSNKRRKLHSNISLNQRQIEYATLKIKYEEEIWKLKIKTAKMEFALNEEILQLQAKEIQERVKLAGYRAKKEMLVSKTTAF
ncbi:uncharacterized protein [Prorops nasuta]|uniref:uncharacterized protein n=1 Tax=Prorops nasuta TaxID=863751 RepID=UPI0034CEEE6D